MVSKISRAREGADGLASNSKKKVDDTRAGWRKGQLKAAHVKKNWLLLTPLSLV